MADTDVAISIGIDSSAAKSGADEVVAANERIAASFTKVQEAQKAAASTGSGSSRSGVAAIAETAKQATVSMQDLANAFAGVREAATSATTSGNFFERLLGVQKALAAQTRSLMTEVAEAVTVVTQSTASAAESFAMLGSEGTSAFVRLGANAVDLNAQLGMVSKLTVDAAESFAALGSGGASAFVRLGSNATDLYEQLTGITQRNEAVVDSFDVLASGGSSALVRLGANATDLNEQLGMVSKKTVSLGESFNLMATQGGSAMAGLVVEAAALNAQLGMIQARQTEIGAHSSSNGVVLGPNDLALNQQLGMASTSDQTAQAYAHLFTPDGLGAPLIAHNAMDSKDAPFRSTNNGYANDAALASTRAAQQALTEARVRDEAESNREVIAAQALTDKYIAGSAAMRRLAADKAALAGLVAKGAVSESEVEDITTGMNKVADAANKTKQSYTGMAFGSSIATRELVVMGRELGRGDMSRLAGSMTILWGATMGWSGAMVATLAGVGAFAVGIGAMISHSMTLSAEMRELTGATIAYNNAALSGSTWQGMAHSVAYDSAFSRTSATEATQYLASQRNLSSGNARDISGASGAFSTGTGKSLADGTKELAEAAQSGYAGIMKLQSAYGMLTSTQLDEVRRLEETGHQAEAFSIAIGALKAQMTAAAHEIEGPGALALRAWGNAITTVMDNVVNSPGWKLFMDALAVVGKAATPSAPVSPYDQARANLDDAKRLKAESDHTPGGYAQGPGGRLNRATVDDLLARRQSEMDAEVLAAKATQLEQLKAKNAQDEKSRKQQEQIDSDLAKNLNVKFYGDGKVHGSVSTASMFGPRQQIARAQDAARLQGMDSQSSISAKQLEANLGAASDNVTAASLGRSNDAVDLYTREAAASRAVAEAYAQSSKAGVAMTIEQAAQVESARDLLAISQARTEQLAKQTAAVEAFIAAQAKEQAGYGRQAGYRASELQAAGLSSGALAQARAADRIREMYAPQIAAASGEDAATLTKQMNAKIVESYRETSATIMEDMETSRRELTAQAALAKARSGADSYLTMSPADREGKQAYSQEEAYWGARGKGLKETPEGYQSSVDALAQFKSDAATQASLKQSQLGAQNTIMGNPQQAAQDLASLKAAYEANRPAIDANTQATIRYQMALNELDAKAKNTNTSMQGFNEGLLQVAYSGLDSSKNMASVVTSSFSTIGDTLLKFSDGAQRSTHIWHDMVYSILQDMDKMLIIQPMLGSLAMLMYGGSVGAGGGPAGAGAGTGLAGMGLSGMFGLGGALGGSAAGSGNPNAGGTTSAATGGLLGAAGAWIRSQLGGATPGSLDNPLSAQAQLAGDVSAQDAAWAAEGSSSATVDSMLNSPALAPVPAFASGTDDAPPGFALVGEQGPELMQMGGGERVYPHSQTSALLNPSSGGNGGAGGDTHFHTHVDARGAQDPAAVAAAVDAAVAKHTPALLAQAKSQALAANVDMMTRNGRYARAVRGQ